MNYGGGWSGAYQSGFDPRFGAQQMNPSWMQPQAMTSPQGWLGALGNANYPTGQGGVPGAPGGGGPGALGWAQLGLGAIGGIVDKRERDRLREEEQRRYEQELEEQRRHREAMGRSLSAAWGG